jgi:Mg2+ and Co2+ transporter CorA
MRLLAIVSALALIPAVVGGLMGMNLADNPWPATLAQVAFGTFVLMLCVLYTFLAKGWLR